MSEGLRGLSSTEAAQRLARDGFNELEPPRRRTVLRIAGEVVREPMLQLLIAAGAVYVLLGDRTEALMLLSFVAITASITILQERRAERVLESLRDLASPRALVIRDGERRRIPGRDVVMGDLLVLAEGDRVPADGLLIESTGCRVDESLLTGESVPVSKVAAEAVQSGSFPSPDASAEPARPGGDATPWVFGGTLVVGGQGVAQVVAVGARSEIGRVGRALSTLGDEVTPLQRRVRALVRTLSVLGLGLSLLAMGLYAWTRGDGLGGLLAGITLAMALLPEELPLILTVFMAMGSWRLSRQRVLTRRAAAIETLGSATVLCTDKTGTLTQNRMRIAELQMPALQTDASGLSWSAAGMGEGSATLRSPSSSPSSHAVPWLPGEGLHVLLSAGLLASEPEPVDPMERAFFDLATQVAPDALHKVRQAQRLRTYGLSRELLVMSQIWALPDESDCIVAAKGAPEAVIALCRLQGEAAAAVRTATDAMAQRGLRVLGVAHAQAGLQPWPEAQQGFDFRFLGLVGLADPLRESVPDAMRLARQAGIRVAMITGDYPATARAIARQAGIDADGEVVTGEQIRQMDERELRERVRHASVFARVMPEQKLRIVQALRDQGEVVAMTGDGVNDAPSLKAAHIGIAMGSRGTDVAREASDIVLLDDDFGSIVQAVQLGRRIDDNLRKAMGFTFGVHVPIAGLSLLPLLFGLPLILSPIHVAFLELVIDPVASLVFEAEPEEPDLMQRPPRDPQAPLLGSNLYLWAMAAGAVVLGVCLGWFVWLLGDGASPEQARACAFITLVMGNLALVLANRSLRGSLIGSLIGSISRPNPILWGIVSITLLLLTAILSVEALRGVFRFAAPSGAQWLGCIALAALCLPMLQVLRWFGARFVPTLRVAT